MRVNLLKVLMPVAVLLLILPGFTRGQSFVVTGMVTDDDDYLPLTGCMVQVKGTSLGTVADLDGKYRIQAERGDTLIFSFLGYNVTECVVLSEILNVNFKGGTGYADYDPIVSFSASVPVFDASVQRFPHSFAFGIFEHVCKEQRGENISVSPWGVTSLLAILQSGAKGDTWKEIIEALDLKGWRTDSVNRCYKGLSEYFSRRKSTARFINASSIWVDKGIVLTPSFRELCKEYYNANAEALDFRNPSSIAKINNWVSCYTEGKISSVIDGFKPDQKLLLANAVYFKGTWKYKFHEKNTLNEYFTNYDSSQSQVRMMNLDYYGYYVEGSGYEGVTMDYAGGTYCMTVLLPEKGEDIQSLVSKLYANNKNWEYIRRKGKFTDIVLKFPKFKIDCNLPLKGALQNLGMKQAFEESADLGGMSESLLRVDAIDQRDVVEVDEEGTEAVASTSVRVVSYGSSSSKSDVVYFYVDRPFVFLISEKLSGTILFIGKVERL